MKLQFPVTLALAALCAVPTAGRAQNRIPTDLTNIAAASNGGRILSVTSTLDNDQAFAGGNLIDGQAFNQLNGTGSKGWSSDHFDPINMESATFAFKGNAVRKIGKLIINPSTALPMERWAKDIEVQVSTETAEGPYTAIAQITLKRAPVAQEFPIFPADARFVRLLFRSNWGSDRAVSLGEVEMYEAIDTSDPFGLLISHLENAVVELESYRKTQIDASNGGGVRVETTPARGKTAPLSAATLHLVQMAGGDVRSTPISSQNIASSKNGGKIMAYSSVFNNDPAYGPDKLIDGANFSMTDGKGSFGWASQGFTPGKEFVTLGFKDDRPRLVGKFVLNPVSNQADLRWARRVDVQVTMGSYKDGPWRTLTSLNLRSEGVNQEFILRPTEAKYLRFIFMANGPGVDLPDADPNVNSDRSVSLGEIEVYEAVSTGDQLEAILGQFKQVLFEMKRLHHDPNLLKPADATATPAVSHGKPGRAARPTTTGSVGTREDLVPWMQGPPIQTDMHKAGKQRRSEAHIAENMRRTVG